MRWMFCALAATLALAACANAQAPVDEVTESQAYDRVDSYMRRAATALPKGASLEPAEPATSTACKGETRRVKVTSSYWIRGITDDNEHFDTMLRWWTEHDFEVLDDLRPERHYVWVRNPADGFRMSLRDNDHGALLLGVESPCLAEE